MNSAVTTSVSRTTGTDLTRSSDSSLTPQAALPPTSHTIIDIELAEIGRELAELAVEREMALRMPSADTWLAEIREQQRPLRQRAAHLHRQLANHTYETLPGRHP